MVTKSDTKEKEIKAPFSIAYYNKAKEGIGKCHTEEYYNLIMKKH